MMHNRMKWLPWILLFAWMGLIFYLSHQPGIPKFEDYSTELLVKKIAHVLVYAILMGLWWRALLSTRPATLSTLLMALGLTILYGISDEWHQTFIPERHGKVADVFFDTAGALSVFIIIRFQQKANDKNQEDILTVSRFE